MTPISAVQICSLKRFTSFCVAVVAVLVGGVSATSFFMPHYDPRSKVVIAVACVTAVLFLFKSAKDAGSRLSPNSPSELFWRKVSEKSAWRIGPFSAWLIGLAAILTLPAIFFVLTPHQLRVPHHTAFLANDGRVLYYSPSFYEVDRYAAGAFVPLRQDHNLIFWLRQGGRSVQVSLTTGMTLEKGEAFERFLQHYQSNVTSYEESAVQKHYFASVAQNFMQDPVERVIAEVEGGAVPGSQANMLLRLSALLGEQGSRIPPWIGRLDIKRMNVVTVTSFSSEGR
jgi:hypothetical protein